MMRAYAIASGYESFKAEREDKVFNLNSALFELLQIVNPKASISHEDLIKQELEPLWAA